MLGLVSGRGALVLAAAVAAATACAIAACGSFGESAFGVGQDGGNEDAGASDSGHPFGDAAADASGFPGPSSLLAVHASPDLKDLRFCFSVGENGRSFGSSFPEPRDQPMPESNYPGVPVGGGAVLPMVRALQTSSVVTVYAIRASQLTSEPKASATCASLICAPGQTGGDCLDPTYYDFVALQVQPPSDWGGASTAFMQITGCLPHTTAPPNVCGADYDPNAGNLRAEVRALRLLPVAEPGVMAVEFVQLSSGVDEQWLAQAGDASSFGLGYGALGADASLLPVATHLHYGDLAPSTPPYFALLDLPDAQAGYAGIGLTLDVHDGDGGLAQRVPISLATLAKISDPRLLPADYLHPRGAYVIAVVGDPSDPHPLLVDGGLNPDYQGRALHAIALPAATDAGALP